MNMSKLPNKRHLIRKLDSYWSQKIRSKGKCERCGLTNKRLEMAHIISRNNKTLRWDESNLLCLCTTCHFWAHQNPLGFADFVRINYPKRYTYLMEFKGRLTKYTAKDLKERWDKQFLSHQLGLKGLKRYV